MTGKYRKHQQFSRRTCPRPCPTPEALARSASIGMPDGDWDSCSPSRAGRVHPSTPTQPSYLSIYIYIIIYTTIYIYVYPKGSWVPPYEGSDPPHEGSDPGPSWREFGTLRKSTRRSHRVQEGPTMSRGQFLTPLAVLFMVLSLNVLLLWHLILLPLKWLERRGHQHSCLSLVRRCARYC